MKRKITLTSILIATLCGLVSSHGLKRRNIYVEMNVTWQKSQQFCREHYSDLSYISSEADKAELLKAHGTRSPAWIGLYRDSIDADWKWSGKENESPTQFGFNLLDYGMNNCVSLRNPWMTTTSCDAMQSFYCYEDEWLVLVQENKTWDEALEHCRDNYGDLVSLPLSAQLQSRLPILWADVPQVWTGLRFLAGYWLWVNGDALELHAWSAMKLPVCPGHRRHCGILDGQGSALKAWNCQKTLNFICSVRVK